MKMLAWLAVLIGLGACSHTEELAMCKGPAFALNTGHWEPAQADLQLPTPGRTE
jgi:hypothetical protein